MASRYTDARKALLAALEADANLTGMVRTWRRFDGGLRERLTVKAAYCPLLGVYPGPVVEPDQRMNAAYDEEQQVIVVCSAAGEAPDDCEQMLEWVLDVVRAQRAVALGMVDDGVKNLVPSVTFSARPEAEGKRLIWHALVTVRIRWIRLN